MYENTDFSICHNLVLIAKKYIYIMLSILLDYAMGNWRDTFYPTITQNNVKIANGMDTVNMEINKLDYDYMNHRLNAVERVYQTPQNDSNGEITTMKVRLEDNKIATRIDPSLLNPFRNNPLTQSLESFAY